MTLGPIHSHVPHGLIRCASTARSACASVPTVTLERRGLARGDVDGLRVGDEPQHVVVGLRRRRRRRRPRRVWRHDARDRRRAGEREFGAHRVAARRRCPAGIVDGDGRPRGSSPGGSTNGSSSGVGGPAGRADQPHPAVQRRVGAVAGRGEPQLQRAHRDRRRAGAGAGARRRAARRAVRVRGCAASTWRRAVAPASASGRQRRAVGVEHPRQVEMRPHGGDLVAVQLQLAVGVADAAARAGRVVRRRRRCADRSGAATSVGAAEGFDQPHAMPSAASTCCGAAARRSGCPRP